MNAGVQALEDQYFLLRGSLPALTAAGASPDQLAALRTAIATSRTNYWQAVNRVLHEDDPAVEALIQQLTTQQNALQQVLAHVGEVSRVLNVVAQVVSLGSQLVQKAVTL